MRISMSLALSVVALAWVVPQLALSEEGFEKRKAEALANMDEHIQMMQKNRACVAAAPDHETMRKCRESMKDMRKGERMESLEKRGARIDQRMDKLKGKPGPGRGQGQAPGSH